MRFSKLFHKILPTTAAPTSDARVLAERLSRLASAAHQPQQAVHAVSQLDVQAVIVAITEQVSDGARVLAELAACSPSGQRSALLDASADLHDALPSLCAAAVTTVDVAVTTPMTVTTLPR